MDILVAGSILIILSPIILTFAILIKLDSKGPIFYVSKRVGKGYKIFNFYKFRSMRVDADALVDKLKRNNQYLKVEEKPIPEVCEKCTSENKLLMIMDGRPVCEHYVDSKKLINKTSFVKFQNDPRITKLGEFLRRSSVDELPQLWNVLKGDMSLVGNRPLPLYEAEKLTRDQSVLRFEAPAGITGLWQVSKRGKSDMSEEERIELDNEYATNRNLIYDMKLLIKTIPAIMQKENV
ncbi:sugar transferase (plasmid) [Chondrinema litorale]|nr:sugar transferase [Chondrinema litorale]UZR98048.1 sugar transferase [Chondrinema litorale]